MEKKKIIIGIICCLVAAGMSAQELQEIRLKAPDKTRGSATMKALSDRHSDRAYSPRELDVQDLSDLLWAANGVNRPDGKRTAPSAMNRQEVDVYAIRADGAYLYDAPSHSLKPVAGGDFRAAVAGGQEFAATAPVCLVTVVNLDRLGDPKAEHTRIIGAVDAGIVTQNINLFCAAVGLSTVPRASMDQEKLREALKLNDSQLPVMNNPVGYPEK
ncbi:MAG: SagB/ThcOx family dehydrogenase [Tannerella sp.]|jgi:SagB-type dehydrogenase family enzyme|nr:SagB/ThcOx family dehydrogenase [Tannerella sp.]